MEVNNVLKLNLLGFHLLFNYVCAYMFVLGYIHVSTSAHGSQRR